MEPSVADPLLRVEGLQVSFRTRSGVAAAVDGVSLRLDAGERVAVVGESGSGKSVTASAIVGLVPPPGRIVAGSIRFGGKELTSLDERQLARVRGREIGLVLQDPIRALDPLKTIGSQIGESLRLHSEGTRPERRRRTLDLIREVRIGDPEQRIDQYGHQLSGGMSQRAMIAAAIAPQPRLLIADEPTSALDATTADGVLELLSDLAREEHMAILLITHDLGVVTKFAERVIVMYAGRIVEDGPVDDVLARPTNPYTRGLLESVPGRHGKRKVAAIPGVVPDLTALPSGCSFNPRCALREGRARCAAEEPALRPVTGSRSRSACHFAEELVGSSAAARPGPRDEPAPPPAIGSAMLEVQAVSRSFKVSAGPFRSGGVVRAVERVSFDVRHGEVLALVGESGSGKSTTARMILGLDTPSAGRILFEGRDLHDQRERRDPALRSRIQAVFQNPDASLNPRMRVGSIVGEPLDVHGIGTPAARRERVASLLEQVGLRADHVGRYPYEFSGGQRQRIAIARALALAPEIVICDEPVTALDVSVQAQILNLLQDIQRESSLAYLFIAHDLSVVRQIADRVAVMYLGQIVEVADAGDFFRRPRHPYSAALLSSMSAPPADGAQGPAERIILSGAVPSPFDPPPACRFHTRCWKAQPVCSEVAPELLPGGQGRLVACHFPEGKLEPGPSADVAAPVAEGS